jgi:cell division FtsZ-interacting protein ZapD
MSLKKTVLQQGMKLMSDPRVLKLMQDERFMKVVMAAMSVPGKVQTFAEEHKGAFAKAMGLAPEAEVNDLRRQVRALENELGELKRHEKHDNHSDHGHKDKRHTR